MIFDRYLHECGVCQEVCRQGEVDSDVDDECALDKYVLVAREPLVGYPIHPTPDHPPSTNLN